jgi:hypothetical protein
MRVAADGWRAVRKEGDGGWGREARGGQARRAVGACTRWAGAWRAGLGGRAGALGQAVDSDLAMASGAKPGWRPRRRRLLPRHLPGPGPLPARPGPAARGGTAWRGAAGGREAERGVGVERWVEGWRRGSRGGDGRGTGPRPGRDGEAWEGGGGAWGRGRCDSRVGRMPCTRRAPCGAAQATPHALLPSRHQTRAPSAPLATDARPAAPAVALAARRASAAGREEARRERFPKVQGPKGHAGVDCARPVLSACMGPGQDAASRPSGPPPGSTRRREGVG